MKNILALIDLSPVSERIVHHAATLARGVSAKLWIVHVASPDPDLVGYDAGPQHVRDMRAVKLRQEHQDMQAMRDAVRKEGTDAEALLVQGPTVETALSEVERLKADLLVLGSHGRSGLYKMLMGSVSEQVLKHARIPVLLVPPPDRD